MTYTELSELTNTAVCVDEIRMKIVKPEDTIIFGAKIEISGTKWVEKTPIHIFSTLGSKINKFERKKSEKNEKIPKT